MPVLHSPDSTEWERIFVEPVTPTRSSRRSGVSCKIVKAPFFQISICGLAPRFEGTVNDVQSTTTNIYQLRQSLFICLASQHHKISNLHWGHPLKSELIFPHSYPQQM